MKENGQFLKSQKCARFFAALIGAFGLSLFLTQASSGNHLLSTAGGIATLVLLYSFWRKEKNQSLDGADLAFSCALSLVFTLGGQLALQNHLDIGFRLFLSIFCLPFACYPALRTINQVLGKLLAKDSSVISKKERKIVFYAILSVNFALWLILFPGIYTFDMASWNEIFSRGTITAHWSITYGLYLALFLDLGEKLFHSYNLGFGVAMLLQMVFVSWTYYRIVLFAAKISKNKTVLWLGLLFFILVPFLSVMSITDAQDVIFGCLFAIVIMKIYEAVHNENYFKKKINLVSFILVAFALVTIRNNGIYCLVFAAPFIALFKKVRSKKYLLASIAAVIVINIIYTGPIYKIFNVRKSDSINEILSVPSQQLAKAYIEAPYSFTPEQDAQMRAFYNMHGDAYDWRSYEQYPLIADFTKDNLNTEYTRQHLGEYVKLYLSVGLKNKRRYVDAFLLNSLGFWLPGKDYNDERLALDYMNYAGFAPTSAFLNFNPSIKKVERIHDNVLTHAIDYFLFNNGWQKVPIISTLCSIGFYSLMLIYAAFRAISCKKRKALVALMPAIGLFATLMLAPVAIYRYIYPIAILTPVIFAIILRSHRKKGALK